MRPTVQQFAKPRENDTAWQTYNFQASRKDTKTQRYFALGGAMACKIASGVFTRDQIMLELLNDVMKITEVTIGQKKRCKMPRVEILRILKTFKEKHAEKYGITTLGLFGSVARDENQEGSDVDVVVELKKQDMFNMIGIKQDLEETLNTHVDVISYREKMNAFLKNRIDKETLYV